MVAMRKVLAIGNGSVARYARHADNGVLARKMMGFAIVSSGLAVLVVQGLQHALGG